METLPEIQDVVVIGGGPAGSTTAAYLAMAGHSVTLLEKEKFPREHVGESLLPYCYHVFKDLGVLETLGRLFVRKPGARFVDINGDSRTTWCFDFAIKDESYLSFQVRRGEFDQVLLENARVKGATCLEETTVTDINMEGPDGIVEVMATGKDGEALRYRARFLVDASGQRTFLASRNKWKKPNVDLDRSAMYSYWHNPRFENGLEEGLILVSYLGGEKKGWIWLIPTDVATVSVGCVFNNAYIKEQKKKFQDQGSEDWQRDLYLQELSYSPFASSILEPGECEDEIRFVGNYSYSVDNDLKFGDNYCLVGDAGTFVDPVFSSGVYLALNSGKLVANAIHEKLSNGEDVFPGTFDRISGAYRMVYKLVSLFYDPKSINFAQAGAASEIIGQEHETAMAIGHYLLAGDFFDNHERYNNFIDLLQNPRVVKKYTDHVVDRPSFQAPTCGNPREVAFPMLKESTVS